MNYYCLLLYEYVSEFEKCSRFATYRRLPVFIFDMNSRLYTTHFIRSVGEGNISAAAAELAVMAGSLPF